jgi:predicted nucleotidyltransferase
VIVYGAESAKRVQRSLFSLAEKDRKFHRYSLRDLRRLYSRRALGHAIMFDDFKSQEKRKAFQGRFLRHEYFVRCVKDWKEISECYGESRYTPYGTCTLSAQVADDTEGLLTPCRYLLDRVKVLAGAVRNPPYEIISFRGRFAEQAYKGERVIARGRLELVRSKESKHFRLVVGEGSRDIVRTIE